MKVFGAGTQEQREEKLKILDENILSLEERVQASREVLEKFESKALSNVDKFHQRKMADITDMFITHIVMMIEQCKKSRSTWANIREACECM